MEKERFCDKQRYRPVNTNTSEESKDSCINNTIIMMHKAVAHLHDTAQIPDVRPLRLNDLHHHSIHIRELGVRRHGDAGKGGRVFSALC